MGVEKSVSVFFGTWVDKKSDAGKKLAALIDAHGGTPAPTDCADVQISQAGNAWSGETQIVAFARGTWTDIGSLESPKKIGDAMLEDDAVAIDNFLTRKGITNAAPIGWYVAERVF